MKEVEVFNLLAQSSKEILRKLNPKKKNVKTLFTKKVLDVLAENDNEVKALLKEVPLKLSSKNKITVSKWLNYAYHEAFLNGSEKVEKAHLFFALILCVDIEKYYLLRKLMIVKSGLDVDLTEQSFVQDLTEIAKKIDQTFIGREKELTKLIVNLSTQNEEKPTMLLGDSGVGKTSMMIELAKRINNGLVPANLLGSRILRVKFGILMSMLPMDRPGIQNEFFSKLFSDISAKANNNGKIILFLDDLRIGSAFFISFGPVSKSLGLTIVAGAQNDINEKFWDTPIPRMWNIISLDEQSDDDYLKILESYAAKIGSNGNIKYSKETLKKIIEFYHQGMITEGMPGEGIKLLEQLAIFKRHKIYDYSEISSEIKNLDKVAKLANSDDSASGLSVGSSLMLKLDEKVGHKIEQKLSEMVSLSVSIEEKDVEEYVDISDFERPKNDSVLYDKKKLLKLEKSLKKEIIGQDSAIEALARALIISSLKLTNESRPIGSFLFLGPTGVGKTETAKALAKYLYGFKDKNKKLPANFIRIDLSEYAEKHNVSKLFGAPPGYVGYDDMGSLVDFVMNNPTCVVLFDEIDKAHPEVLNSLLHIMDEGEIRNNKGDSVSFENVIIIMTSNHGAELINKEKIGFDNRKSDEWKAVVMDNLKSKLKPEFINRFDEIIVFDKLNAASVYTISSNYLENVEKSLKDLKITLKVSKGAIEKLIESSNYDEYGARDIKRGIKKEIIDPIARIVLEKPKTKIINVKAGKPIKLETE